MDHKNNHLFPYRWNLADGYPAKNIELHNKTVFSTFSCGGGSSMGYKLAGYKVLAANDIDNQMRNVYIRNHHPKYYVFGDVRSLLTKNYPEAFYNLDVLDGSPPCSTFSISGDREKAWGVEKQFREGQSVQTLDDLFFDFIALAKKLQPKTIIAENVKGLITGNAKGYFLEIVKQFNEAGYNVQSFLLNGASMGLPQKRQRVFILCRRKDLDLPDIDINFSEPPILFREVKSPGGKTRNKLSAQRYEVWRNRLPSDIDMSTTMGRVFNRPNSFFNHNYVKDDAVPYTITSADLNTLYSEPRYLNETEIKLIGSFPLDYDFLDVEPSYLIGMSVPPVMMAQVSYQVYRQWLSKI
jgi:DNA (cytosine-5)-methyltransferase 1